MVLAEMPNPHELECQHLMLIFPHFSMCVEEGGIDVGGFCALFADALLTGVINKKISLTEINKQYTTFRMGRIGRVD